MNQRNTLARAGGAATFDRVTSQRWALALAGTTAFALLVATQNALLLQRAGSEISWWTLAIGELPVWYAWLALFPAIRALAIRFPPIGRAFARNFLLHVVMALVSTLVMIAVATLVRMQIDGLIPPRYGYLDAVGRAFRGSFIVFLPVYGIIVTGVLAWNYYQDTQERTLQQSQLQAALASARLDALRDQLQPHFFFNSLHAVSALMSEDVPAARRMMRRLSELLRLTLEEGPHEVSLERELEILGMYVDIQEIRFGDRLEVEYRITPDTKTLLVPRFLLQPLVENSIKHGLATRGGAGRITVEAERSDEALHLCIRDDGPGFATGEGPRRHGIGLRNTKARLEHLYGADYSLKCENAADGGAMVLITVPARPMDAERGT